MRIYVREEALPIGVKANLCGGVRDGKIFNRVDVDGIRYEMDVNGIYLEVSNPDDRCPIKAVDVAHVSLRAEITIGFLPESGRYRRGKTRAVAEPYRARIEAGGYGTEQLYDVTPGRKVRINGPTFRGVVVMYNLLRAGKLSPFESWEKDPRTVSAEFDDLN